MQPLSSKVRSPDAHVEFGNPDTMIGRQTVAVRIAQCIAEWADIESLLGLLLAAALSADASAALAIWSALDNRAAQLRMLSAVLEKLPPEQSEIWAEFDRLYLRPAMKERDKLAHWCWGFSPELPNDLLLMEPSEKLEFHHNAFGSPTKPSISGDEIFVVTEDDLIRLAGRLLRVKDWVLHIRAALRESAESRAGVFQQLAKSL